MKLLIAISTLLIVILVAFLVIEAGSHTPNETEAVENQEEVLPPGPAGKPQGGKRGSTERSEIPTSPARSKDAVRQPVDPSLRIEGVVVDPAGKPIPGSQVRAFEGTEARKQVGWSKCDEQGSFWFSVPKKGNYLLFAEDSLLGRSTRRLLSRRVQSRSGEKAVRIQLERGKAGEIHALLTGIGEDKIPYRILVHIKPTDGEFGLHARLVDCPEGRMKLLAVPPGSYELVFFIPELVADSPFVVVHDQQVTDLGRLYFHPKGQIAGVITDDMGKPIQGIGIVPGRGYDYARSTPRSFLRSVRPTILTDAQGRFRTPGFRTPWTPVAFVALGYAPIEMHLKSADEARTLRLRMHRSATLVLRDLPPFPERAHGKAIFMSLTLKATELPPSYTLVEAGALHTRGIQIVVRDPQKGITIPGLPPGQYDIRLYKDWHKKKPRQQVKLKAGETTELSW